MNDALNDQIAVLNRIYSFITLFHRQILYEMSLFYNIYSKVFKKFLIFQNLKQANRFALISSNANIFLFLIQAHD